MVIMIIIQKNNERNQVEIKRLISLNKAILSEAENILINPIAEQLSNDLKSTLYKRILRALIQIQKISVNNFSKNKIRDTEFQIAKLTSINDIVQSMSDIDVPDTDLEVIAIIQFIKKIKMILISEYKLGNVESSIYSNEEALLSMSQIRLSVETHYSKALKARAADKIGTARTSFEKALEILQNHDGNSEYKEKKMVEISDRLNDIAEDLKTANDDHLKKVAKKEYDELDALFKPKQKW